MRRAWIALISLVLAIGCSPAIPKAAVEAPLVPQKMHFPEKSAFLTHTGRSTVAFLDHLDGSILKPYCTGTFISKDTILTAAHCIEAAALHQSVDGNRLVNTLGFRMIYTLEKDVAGLDMMPRAVYNATVTKIDSPHDLALVRSNDLSDHDVAKIAEFAPSIGSTVYIVGHNAKLYFHYMTGTVSQYRSSIPGDDRDLSYMEIDSHLFYGNSGGATFNDDGEITGVVEAVNPDVPGVGWCIDIPHIDAFLAKNKF